MTIPTRLRAPLGRLLDGSPEENEAGEFALLVFRIFFSFIFILLGGEHLFRDALIQDMMPEWLGPKRFWSVVSGLMILAGGGMVAIGLLARVGGLMLVVFLIPVTAIVHASSISGFPPDLPERWHWLWNVYHQGSLVKNLSLLGGSVFFAFHGAGRLSIDAWLRGRRAGGRRHTQ